jgi:uncharacterized protein YeaO (DUF488 family)
MSVRTRRIYDEPSDDDGARVLVDRLWPRGVSKAAARLDAWERDLSPSDELRREFHGHPERWDEFRARYRQELEERDGAAEALARLRELAAGGMLTLLYAANDEKRNNAVALAEMLL